MSGLQIGLSKALFKSVEKADFDDFRCFSLFVRCVVSDERDNFFWEDKWLGDRPNCSLFSFTLSFINEESFSKLQCCLPHVAHMLS